ncbi:MAG: acylphosphatase [Beijerinckiaceae bacterium]
MARAHLIVTGRVQGVGFRAFVAREGHALGLAGWVRNLRDGSVEAEFEGADEKVARLRLACAQGPVHAKVFRTEELPPGADALPEIFQVRGDA